MGIIITILLGALVGWLASKVMNRDSNQGIVADIMVGILGAFVGGFISSLFDPNSEGPSFLISLDLADVFWAFVGALVVSAIWNAITRRSIR